MWVVYIHFYISLWLALHIETEMRWVWGRPCSASRYYGESCTFGVSWYCFWTSVCNLRYTYFNIWQGVYYWMSHSSQDSTEAGTLWEEASGPKSPHYYTREPREGCYDHQIMIQTHVEGERFRENLFSCVCVCIELGEGVWKVAW